MLTCKKIIGILCFTIIVVLGITPVLGQSTTELNLMPVPAEVELGSAKFRIDKNFKISFSQNSPERLFKASNRFLRRLDGRTGIFFDQGIISAENNLINSNFRISIERKGALELGEDESYQLDVQGDRVLLTAITDLGALRGLETLLQLLESDTLGYYFPEVKVIDNPRFAWRGLMIDVARHFQPVNVLKRNLDAMAAVKMNVFHWHLTDDQGFRVESKTHPKLHELGSDGQYYTHKEIKEVVQYASDRCILIVTEFDVPGHASAILKAYPEIGSKKGTYEIERNAGIFDPTLDPTNERTYEILADVFGEIAPLFPGKYFHIGGDENEGKHWDENKHIQRFMKKNGLKSNHDLQTYFNIRLEKILKNLDKILMGWEEIMTPNMPKSAIIHSWRGVNEGFEAGQSLTEAAQGGYKTVLSNGYYIDLMFSAGDHYLVDPIPATGNLNQEEQKLILGGEATMWGELVTPFTIDSRIWPRAVAIAERFWSPAEVTDVDDMYRRLEIISQQLEELGLTHLKNQDVILRNIAQGNDIAPLKTLINVVGPLQRYTRNPNGLMYKSHSPFTLFADAAMADSEVIRHFDALVNDYVDSHDKQAKAEILHYLNMWKENHAQVSKVIENSPVLKEVEKLSYNLSLIADLALKRLDNPQGTANSKWKQACGLTLDAAREQGGRTELRIVDSIAKLVNNVKL